MTNLKYTATNNVRIVYVNIYISQCYRENDHNPLNMLYLSNVCKCPEKSWPCLWRPHAKTAWPIFLRKAGKLDVRYFILLTDNIHCIYFMIFKFRHDFIYDILIQIFWTY